MPWSTGADPSMRDYHGKKPHQYKARMESEVSAEKFRSESSSAEDLNARKGTHDDTMFPRKYSTLPSNLHVEQTQGNRTLTTRVREINPRSLQASFRRSIPHIQKKAKRLMSNAQNLL